MSYTLLVNSFSWLMWALFMLLFRVYVWGSLTLSKLSAAVTTVSNSRQFSRLQFGFSAFLIWRSLCFTQQWQKLIPIEKTMLQRKWRNPTLNYSKWEEIKMCVPAFLSYKGSSYYVVIGLERKSIAAMKGWSIYLSFHIANSHSLSSSQLSDFPLQFTWPLIPTKFLLNWSWTDSTIHNRYKIVRAL